MDSYNYDLWLGVSITPTIAQISWLPSVAEMQRNNVLKLAEKRSRAATKLLTKKGLNGSAFTKGDIAVVQINSQEPLGREAINRFIEEWKSAPEQQ